MRLALCIAGSLLAILGTGCAQAPLGPENALGIPKRTPIANVVLSAPKGGVQLGVDATPSKVGKRVGQGMKIGAAGPAIAGIALAFTPLGFLGMAAAGAVAMVTGAAGAATGAVVGAAEDAKSGRSDVRRNAQVTIESIGLPHELEEALRHAALRECFATQIAKEGLRAPAADREGFLEVEWRAVHLVPQALPDEEPRYALHASAWYSFHMSGLARRRGLIERWTAPRSLSEWSADDAHLARGELRSICAEAADAGLDEIDPGRHERGLATTHAKGA